MKKQTLYDTEVRRVPIRQPARLRVPRGVPFRWQSTIVLTGWQCANPLSNLFRATILLCSQGTSPSTRFALQRMHAACLLNPGSVTRESVFFRDRPVSRVIHLGTTQPRPIETTLLAAHALPFHPIPALSEPTPVCTCALVRTSCAGQRGAEWAAALDRLRSHLTVNLG